MRDYGKIHSTFWTGETGRALRSNPDAQRLAAYLITAPTSNMIGLYYLPLSTICHDVGMTEKGASKALGSLSEGGFAYYDYDSSWVWIVQMARFELGTELKEGDNRIKSVQKLVDAASKTAFAKGFCVRYGTGYRIVEPSPFGGPSEALRSQAQAPAQEQAQAQDTSTGTSTSAKGASPPAADRASEVRKVFEHYKTHRPKRFPKVTSSLPEWSKVLARLKEGFTVETICEAIDGCMRSPWHQGENERQKPFDSLELIVRDAKHIHDFIDVPVRRGPILSGKSQKAAAAAQSLLDREFGGQPDPHESEVSNVQIEG